MKNKHPKWFLGLALGSMMGVAAMTAQAGSELMALLGVLRENNTITEAQYERLHHEVMGSIASAPKESATARKAEQAAAETTPKKKSSKKRAKQTDVTTKGDLKVKSADGNFEFGLKGELWVDWVRYQEDKAELGSGTELRRARLSLSGRLFKDWAYAAEYDFAANESEVKDAYLEYDGFDTLAVRGGQFKEPFSLEDQTSGKAIIFMERALPVNAFAPGRKLGLGGFASGKQWSAAGGLFGESVGSDTDDEGDEGWSMAGRVTFAPLDTRQHVLHLGGSLAFGQPDDENEVRYRTSPESHLTDETLVDTGRIDNVKHTFQYGVDADPSTAGLREQSHIFQLRGGLDF